MNRRGFLKVVFSAAAASAVPIALNKALRSPTPVIYGDGIHDDTAGLQAAFNGQDFVCHKDLVSVSGDTVHLSGGTFLISKTIEVGGTRSLRATHIALKTVPEFSDALVMNFSEGARDCSIEHLTLDTSQSASFGLGSHAEYWHAVTVAVES